MLYIGLEVQREATKSTPLLKFKTKWQLFKNALKKKAVINTRFISDKNLVVVNLYYGVMNFWLQFMLKTC